MSDWLVDWMIGLVMQWEVREGPNSWCVSELLDWDITHVRQLNRVLKESRDKVKTRFDKHAKNGEFSPRDKVLVLLPGPGSSLQAGYSGPYIVKSTSGD